MVSNSYFAFLLARGNVAVCNEFNFYCDPEAVHIVLKDSGIIPFLVTIEPCLEYKISWVCQKCMYEYKRRNR